MVAVQSLRLDPDMPYLFPELFLVPGKQRFKVMVSMYKNSMEHENQFLLIRLVMKQNLLPYIALLTGSILFRSLYR